MHDNNKKAETLCIHAGKEKNQHGTLATPLYQTSTFIFDNAEQGAARFAGEADAHSYNRELQIEGLGAAWALPGLELLMEEPARKGELWQAMRRVRQRWLMTA